jgi:hypothetical protein
MARFTLEQLLSKGTVEQFFDLLLTIGRFLGLETTSWLDGEPSNTMFYAQSEYLAHLESNVRGYIASGFGSLAAADPGLYNWLVLWAYEMFRYEAREATFAETTVTLTNQLGGLFTAEELAAGRLTFNNTTTGKTYVNSSGPFGDEPLLPGPGTTVQMTITANEAGSASNASPGEIELQTGLQGVVATIESAAIGQDRETSASILAGAWAKLGPISPNGAKGANDSIATDANKTEEPSVTRARTFGDSTTGDVSTYLAGPSGAVSPEAVDAVEEAIIKWSTPQCTTQTIASAVNRVVNVGYEIWIYSTIGLTEDEIKEVIKTTLEAYFPLRPIGGDTIEGEGTGYLYREPLSEAIKGQAQIKPHLVNFRLISPATDVVLSEQEVAVLGTITYDVVNIEKRPTG